MAFYYFFYTECFKIKNRFDEREKKIFPHIFSSLWISRWNRDGACVSYLYYYFQTGCPSSYFKIHFILISIFQINILYYRPNLLNTCSIFLSWNICLDRMNFTLKKGYVFFFLAFFSKLWQKELMGERVLLGNKYLKR